MVLGKLDIHMQKNEIGPHFLPYMKINLKWIKDLRPETVKLLEKNMSENPMTLVLEMSSWI